MSENAMVITVCCLWMFNGFALGMAAGIAYMIRQERMNEEVNTNQ